MKRLFLLILIYILCVNVTFSKEVWDSKYFEFVDSADYNIENMNWERAEKFILAALREEPSNYNNSLLLSNLATIQRLQGRIDEAVNNYTLALNITPNAVTLLNNRGILYLEIDSIGRAERDFERVMEIDPRDIESRYYYSLIKIRKRQFEEAKDYINEINIIKANTVEEHDATAKLLQAKGKYGEAGQRYTSLLKWDKRIEWIINRAECYLALKKLNNAADDINEALSLEPTNGYLYLLKAKLKKLQYEKEATIENIERAVSYGVSREYAEAFVFSE